MSPAELRAPGADRAGTAGPGAAPAVPGGKGGFREDAALPRFPPPCSPRCPRSSERRRRPRLAPTAARSPGARNGPGSDPGPAPRSSQPPYLLTVELTAVFVS